MSDELTCVQEMFFAFSRLLSLGWSKPEPAVNAGERLWIIEAGSSQIHEGFCDSDRTYWSHSFGENWPSRPLLVKIFREVT